jgi:hypothetical protein
MLGARVTDEVVYWTRRGDERGAARVVRNREPDRFRWRRAVSTLSAATSNLRGMSRLRVEEPVREAVLDVQDGVLRREVVLDARRHNVDFDRGEILPHRTMGDLRQYAFLIGTDLDIAKRYVRMPDDFDAPVDVGGVVVVCRALSQLHRKRAQRLWLEIPDSDGPERLSRHHRLLHTRAERDTGAAHRWAAFGRKVLGDHPLKGGGPFGSSGS